MEREAVLNDLWSISPRTRLCAVIGHPVGHSLSPVIHNAAYRAMGEDMVYVAFDVAAADLPGAFAGMRALGIRGFSVTIPHKEALLPLVDDLAPAARAAGAANTVVNDHGRLSALSTDGIGAYRTLCAYLAGGGMYPLEGKRVLFLGAGGAARSLAFYFALELPPPAEMIVLGRTLSRAEQLAADLRAVTGVPVRTGAHDHAHLRDVIPHVDLVINCSPVGMHPHPEPTPLPAEILALGRQPDVFDTIPNPPQTRLLREAAALGCRTAPGLAMLVHQAAAQVECFTGKPAPVQTMLDAVRSLLEGEPHS